MYNLYDDAKNTAVVETEITKAISDFVQILVNIDKKYKGTGMTDTSSREHIVEAVSNMIFQEL